MGWFNMIVSILTGKILSENTIAVPQGEQLEVNLLKVIKKKDKLFFCSFCTVSILECSHQSN
jgi:hypothetical protein